MSHIYDESSDIDGMMDILDEKETGEKKKSTVPEEKSDGPSPDLMSRMTAVMIQMVKMLNEGSHTSELLMHAIKQIASSIKPYNVS